MTDGAAYRLGIRPNLRLFLEQLLQVFFVGMTIGAERTVLPTLAERDFGVPPGSFLVLLSFVLSFGLVKGVMNLVSGQLSGRFGRRPLLIAGWIFALPIPFLIFFARDWSWIVAANLFLGVNQGFAWSMTVTAKHDIVPTSQRGLATGLNEFAGYGGVALGGLLTGYLAGWAEPRLGLALFSATVILLALTAALLAFGETLPFARAEASRAAAAGGDPRRPGLPADLSFTQVFALVSWRHRTFAALSQAGSVEKFVDTLVWALLPVFLHRQGASLIEIGWITGTYGFVWGISQLWTGPLSDRIGRKAPSVAGMWICAAGVAAFPLTEGTTAWALAAAVTGVGMALLYPTLIAAVGDLAHPAWRGSGLGVYRFWRDLGYALGALSMGLVAEGSGRIEAGFWFVAAAMALSGLWLALAMQETRR